jgi:hypothetical protein
MLVRSLRSLTPPSSLVIRGLPAVSLPTGRGYPATTSRRGHALHGHGECLRPQPYPASSRATTSKADPEPGGAVRATER